MTTETTSQSPSINTLENNTLAYLSMYQNQQREERKGCSRVLKMEVSFEWQFTLKAKCGGSFESEGYVDLKVWCQVFGTERKITFCFLSGDVKLKFGY